MTPVVSTNIAAVGHEGDELFVQFNNGQMWKYLGVSAAVAHDMVSAGSVGRFFIHRIKGQYPEQRA